jgi:hypothetical protein
VRTSEPLSSEDQIRIENWFKVRMKTDAVLLNFLVNQDIVNQKDSSSN